MQFDVLHEGSNAVLLVSLKRGEKMRAEAGAMVAKSPKLHIRGKMWGGFFGAMQRSVLGGETFFFQEVSAEDGNGDILLAPSLIGDVKVISLADGQDYYVQSGCLLAALDHVEMGTKAQKLTAGLFSGAGFFVLHLKGTGHFVISAFGAIMEVPIPAGQEYIVDNGHVVAWSGDTQYHMVKAGKTWWSSMTSGEGLACKFQGPGKVWIQTRNPRAFGAWMGQFVRGRGGVLSLIG